MEDNRKPRELLLVELSELRRELDALRITVPDSSRIHKLIQDFEKEIAERKRIEGELRESEEKYRALVESTDDSIYLVDKKSRYLFMNKKHMSRLGLARDEVLGKAYSDFHTPEETSEFVGYVDKVIKTGGSAQYEHRSNRDGGYFLWTMSPVVDLRGNIKAVTVVSKNITSLKDMESTLYALSLSDELTGLYNRRGFLTLAKQPIKIARRMKQDVLLIFADMNELKRINDTYGHAQGDIALKDLAKLLKKTFRESDIIARIGGDEFAVLITEFQDGTKDICMKRLHDHIAKFNRKEKRPCLLTISTGAVVCSYVKTWSVDQMLKEADMQMYKQKTAEQKSRP
jgi:diguanylate cyclase (GGDEF)-like protein/PAS domain S-box-containing protein